MTRPGRTGELSMALSMAGLVAFSPPLLFIFGSPGGAVLGIPLIYIYLFAVWIGLIVCTALIAERGRRDRDDSARPARRDPPHPPERPGA